MFNCDPNRNGQDGPFLSVPEWEVASFYFNEAPHARRAALPWANRFPPLGVRIGQLSVIRIWILTAYRHFETIILIPLVVNILRSICEVPAGLLEYRLVDTSTGLLASFRGALLFRCRRASRFAPRTLFYSAFSRRTSPLPHTLKFLPNLFRVNFPNSISHPIHRSGFQILSLIDTRKLKFTIR